MTHVTDVKRVDFAMDAEPSFAASLDETIDPMARR